MSICAEFETRNAETSSQSIRPMPRASEQAIQIIERLEEVRECVQSLSDRLKQVSPA